MNILFRVLWEDIKQSIRSAKTHRMASNLYELMQLGRKDELCLKVFIGTMNYLSFHRADLIWLFLLFLDSV